MNICQVFFLFFINMFLTFQSTLYRLIYRYSMANYLVINTVVFHTNSLNMNFITFLKFLKQQKMEFFYHIIIDNYPFIFNCLCNISIIIDAKLVITKDFN